MERDIKTIEAELKTAGINRDRYNRLQNEGSTTCYNPHEDEIAKLAAELLAAKRAASPLATKEGIIAERAWFNAQGFAAANVANAECLKRGYSMDALFKAAKTL